MHVSTLELKVRFDVEGVEVVFRRPNALRLREGEFSGNQQRCIA